MEEQHPIEEEQDSFYPSGAIAFFLVLMMLFALIWFALYFIMIYRF